MSRHWPLFGLRIRTDRLELRLPTPEDLDALADLAAEGIHDPEIMPFNTEWTDAEPEERGRRVLQHHWRAWGGWSPDDWRLTLTVFESGTVVGYQELGAAEYAGLREGHTESWLGRRYQGRGIGTEMRAAVLHLAFAGLGAEYAISDAYAFNTASLRVSEKLGYDPDGIEREVVRGEVQVAHRVRLSRENWEKHRRHDVRIEGVEPCLPMFGLGK